MVVPKIHPHFSNTCSSKVDHPSQHNTESLKNDTDIRLPHAPNSDYMWLIGDDVSWGLSIIPLLIHATNLHPSHLYPDDTVC